MEFLACPFRFQFEIFVSSMILFFFSASLSQSLVKGVLAPSIPPTKLLGRQEVIVNQGKPRKDTKENFMSIRETP